MWTASKTIAENYPKILHTISSQTNNRSTRNSHLHFKGPKMRTFLFLSNRF